MTGSTKTDRDAGLNYGRCVDLYAPASGVTSVVAPELSPNRLARSDQAATSWAAPLASGVAALYLSTHPKASPQQVRRLDDRQRHHRCHRRRSSRNAEPPAPLPLTSVGRAQLS